MDLTVDDLQKNVPKSIRSKITTELVDDINRLAKEPDLRENFKENIVSYTSVMADGKYKIQGYVDAVKYVSYKLLGKSNQMAYKNTFPDRYARLVAEGADDKTISSYSTAFGKTKLVGKIMEQTLIPVHIINADLYQKALNTQAHLMATANSEKVRCDAANSILVQLKMPEVNKIELDIGIKSDSVISELNSTLKELANKQQQGIESKLTNSLDVANSKIITGEFVEVV